MNIAKMSVAFCIFAASIALACSSNNIKKSLTKMMKVLEMSLTLLFLLLLFPYAFAILFARVEREEEIAFDPLAI